MFRCRSFSRYRLRNIITLGCVIVTGILCILQRHKNNSLYQKDSSKIKNYLEWIKVQDERKQRIQAGCEKVNKLSNIFSLSQLISNRDLLFNFVVDDIHEVLYCYIPKVACTSWKALFIELTRHSKNLSLPLSHETIHSRKNLLFLNDAKFSREEIYQRLKFYRKFMFARHPVERLVSAFRDKLKTGDNAFYTENYGKGIYKKYHKFSVEEQERNITFAEFVKYVTQSNMFSKINSDEHWRPQYLLCHPCAVNYDWIGDFQTLMEDANWILDEIAPNEDIQLNSREKSKTSSLLDQYLQSVNNYILERMNKFFKYDFLLFHYNAISVNNADNDILTS